MRPQPGMLGFGQPPRGPAVDQAKRISDIEDRLDAQAIATAIYPQSVFESVGSLTFPNDNTFHNYATTGTITVPAGYTTLTFFLWGSAGVTAASGVEMALSVAIQSTPGSASPFTAADSVSGGAISLTAGWAGVQTGMTPGTTFTLSVTAAANGASNSGSAGANLMGVLIWST